jgi:hypothetical protein
MTGYGSIEDQTEELAKGRYRYGQAYSIEEEVD